MNALREWSCSALEHHDNVESGYRMVDNGRHISVSQLWEFSKDPDSPEVLFEERSHLTICQDCIAIFVRRIFHVLTAR